ncbi:DNA polymerase Y family protein [Streptomyces sp. TP-A0874]|uniref:DNA polymerase Y family protein n=1 Tax=Streptomyces sp. TP-A0874 TaxID=549819 RepID=UPI00099F5BD0|nr:hypothetical protein [Streptomyces sp. TP-A0874]
MNGEVPERGTAPPAAPAQREPEPDRSGRTPPGAPRVLYVRFHHGGARHPEEGRGEAGGLGAETYSGLLALLAELTPVVEALPPDAALADVRGAVRYFGRDATGIGALLRVRALAHYGVDCSIGVGPNPLLARMAGAAPHRPNQPAGAIRTVPDDPEAVAAFLAGQPAEALYGVGPATARALSAYGLDSADRIAAAPPATLQRILGPAAGRRVHERARGIDPTPVTPNAPARSTAAEHRFDHDELDPDHRRRALLTLAHRIGARLRAEGQVTRALTLTVRYADRSTTTRSRVLAEPTAHTPVLTVAAYTLHAALGLQRARVRALSLRAEELTDAERAVHQLSFDPADDKSRRIEAAADRARARFGFSAVRPAAALDPDRNRTPTADSPPDPGADAA